MIDPAIIKEGIQTESEWGVKQYGRREWAKEDWGRVSDGKVTLFHGTDEYNLSSILRYGIQTSTMGHGYDAEVDIDIPPEEAPTPAIWLAYTPYLAFFFGNVAVKVVIPLDWITEANDGVLIEKFIPAEMIAEVKKEEDWT